MRIGIPLLAAATAGAFLAGSLSSVASTQAQQTQRPSVYVVNFIKANPAKYQEYLQLERETWKTRSSRTHPSRTNALLGSVRRPISVWHLPGIRLRNDRYLCHSSGRRARYQRDRCKGSSVRPAFGHRQPHGGSAKHRSRRGVVTYRQRSVTGWRADLLPFFRGGVCTSSA